MNEQVLARWNEYPFYKWAGLRIIEAHEGRATIALQVQDHHRGGGGTQAINGGIMAYLFDGLLGAAVVSVWDEGVIGQVTTSLNVQYISMLQATDEVLGKAQVIKKGKRVVFVDGEIYDAQGQLCARCQGAFQLRRKD
ncbi:PaaI family thioesterase [Eisenibacter elegans]|jgi:uncharacterized protein (TIGR00369 family)|uniref:PaaI family thioesterase n=1 Tax=Eisenibacter elegans TaxID=997 RepID=UPI0003FF932D|nr:PaaI family thioesterase [Eisenibacter elegans]